MSPPATASISSALRVRMSEFRRMALCLPNVSLSRFLGAVAPMHGMFSRLEEERCYARNNRGGPQMRSFSVSIAADAEW
jgi:hypothetical protein